jgi:aspartate racemase
MKKIGIVGGIAWLSTADYYAGICRRSEQWHLARNAESAPSYPEMSIESLDLSKVLSYLGNDEDEQSWTQYDDYHRAALQRVEANGADFAIIASNTPHHRFATIVRGIGIPVISILDAVAKKSAGIGAKEVLILGTAITMKSAKFREGFAKLGIRAAGPNNEAARAMTVELITELQRGNDKGATQKLGKIARNSLEGNSKAQPVVCLACTELPLAFPEQRMLESFESDDIVYINTSAVHMNAAFGYAVGEET